MPFLGNLAQDSNYLADRSNFKYLSGPADPRYRTTAGENFTPGEDLEARGFNAFQDQRRRSKLSHEALVGEANQLGLSGALDRTRKDVGRAFDSSTASLERRQKGLGLRLTERQKRSQTRQLGLSRTLARAHAVGATRRGFAERATKAQAGASAAGDAVQSLQDAGFTNIVSRDATEAQRLANERARKKEDKYGTIGTAIGIAGSIASWFSSEELKHDHGREGNLLEKLKKVRVHRWQYKGDDKTHVGPFSEEFNKEFDIDTDRPDMINVIDALGVTLGAVKELSEKVHGD